MRIRLLEGVVALAFAGVLAAQETPSAPAAADAPADAAGTPAASVAAADAGPAQPGDAAAGEAKAAACAACHGIDGNSADPQYPKIAGQHEVYTARHLALFKNGGRENPIMLGFAATLSAQDMRDLGAFYAAKTGSAGVANDAAIPGSEETWVARGERLYRGGNAATGMPACMACHGPSGRGNPGAGYPSIAGQHADYTKAQLQKFRAGQVYGRDAEANAVMAGVAAQLDDTDIEALATYIEGLHQRPAAAAGSR